MSSGHSGPELISERASWENYCRTADTVGCSFFCDAVRRSSCISRILLDKCTWFRMYTEKLRAKHISTDKYIMVFLNTSFLVALVSALNHEQLCFECHLVEQEENSLIKKFYYVLKRCAGVNFLLSIFQLLLI